MKLTIEKKTLAVIAAFLLGTGLIVMFIIIPTIRHLRELDRETYNLRLYLERRYEHSIRVHSSLADLERIKTDTASYPEHLFRKGDELKLITLLENIAAKNGMAQKINSSNIDSLANNNRVKIALTVAGPYLSALRYLRDLEQTPYFITSAELQLSQSAERGQPSQLAAVTLNLNLSLYVSP